MGAEAAGVTVSVDCAELPLYVAVMVAVWFELTELVEIVNVAEVAASRTVTVAGTVTTVELDESATIAPPASAG